MYYYYHHDSPLTDDALPPTPPPTSHNNVVYDTEEELFRHFTKNVQRNLHVVFTMNPASGDFDNRAATSPALFNRCVVDWFGDWSRKGKCVCRWWWWWWWWSGGGLVVVVVLLSHRLLLADTPSFAQP